MVSWRRLAEGVLGGVDEGTLEGAVEGVLGGGTLVSVGSATAQATRIVASETTGAMPDATLEPISTVVHLHGVLRSHEVAPARDHASWERSDVPAYGTRSQRWIASPVS
jgi:hypothetical protein